MHGCDEGDIPSLLPKPNSLQTQMSSQNKCATIITIFHHSQGAPKASMGQDVKTDMNMNKYTHTSNIMKLN